MPSPTVNSSKGIDVISGMNDRGYPVNIATTGEGHLEVEVHGPRLPYGSISCEALEPVYQIDAVYGLNTDQWTQTTGINVAGTTSATITGTGNLFKCSTGTTAYSYASLQTKERLRYRAGQGVVDRFSFLFSTPVASSILVSGVGTGESGLFFGYNGTSFGILHSNSAVREIQTLTVTTASTATDDYVVTLSGTAFTATATNNNSTLKTAYEISKGTYTGWAAEQIGSTVVFLASAVGNKAGAFSLAQTGAGTPAAGSFVETLAGVAATDTWYPQTSWNSDKMDGSGPSGVTLNPQVGNMAQISIQMGFGAISFEIQTGQAGNNPNFVTVHTIPITNSQATVSLTQPSFPHTIAAYSAGSTTNVWVAGDSVAGFIEGQKKLTGSRMTFSRETNNFVGSAASTYYPIFTVKNDLTHGHGGVVRANQSVVNLLSTFIGHDDATPVILYLIRNATLVGTPNFTAFSTISCCTWDVAATTCTIALNEQLLASLPTGQSSGDQLDFIDDFTVRPGETITVAARAVTGTATYVIASLNTREDQ